MNEVKVAMVGFGGIAQSHKHAYEQLEAAGEPSVGKWRGGAGSRWHAWRGCRRVFWSKNQ